MYSPGTKLAYDAYGMPAYMPQVFPKKVVRGNGLADVTYRNTATVLTEGKVMITKVGGLHAREIMQLSDWLILADGAKIVVLSTPSHEVVLQEIPQDTASARAAVAAEEAVKALAAATAEPSDASAIKAFVKANMAEEAAKTALEAASAAQKIACKLWAAQITKDMYPLNPGFLAKAEKN